MGVNGKYMGRDGKVSNLNTQVFRDSLDKEIGDRSLELQTGRIRGIYEVLQHQSRPKTKTIIEMRRAIWAVTTSETDWSGCQ